MYRKALLIVACITTMALLTTVVHAQNSPHRVIFVLTSSEEADWRLTLGNIHNLLSGMPPNSVEVELVAYGPGLSFEKRGSSAEQEIRLLETNHVRFVACEKSMRMQQVTLADLPAGVVSVPSGVVEVVSKQEQGWTYIKAGR